MSNRVAVVTGGGSGIGAAVARRLVAADVDVVIVGRRIEVLDDTAADLGGLGGRVVTVAADLGASETPALIVDRTLAEFGRIDHLVNNAAFIRNRLIDDVTPADFSAAVAVNMAGSFFLIQAALPSLRESPCAAIVNVTSAAAALARPTQSVYGMTKAAVEHMTRSLAMELAPTVRVNTVAPGPTETGMMSLSGADGADARRAALRRELPSGRIGEPDDVARWVTMLLEPESVWVTGATLRIDGGRVLGSPESK